MSDRRFVLNVNELDDPNFGLASTFFSDFGGAFASASATITHTAQASSALGGSIAEASGEVIITIVAIGNAELDGITAQASATITHNAQASSAFGSLTASASANIDNPATASAPLGEMIGSGSAVVSHPAQAASPLGDASGSAQAVVVITAQGATLIPAATITANGTVIPFGEAIANAPLGSLVASASATVRKQGGTAGGLLLQRIPPQPQPQIVKQEEPQEPEPIEPIREPQEVFALSYARLPSVRARAVGNVVWIAEKDDEEILMLIG